MQVGDIVRYHRGDDGFKDMQGAMGIVRQVEAPTAKVSWITGRDPLPNWNDLDFHWTPPENAVIFPAEASDGE